MDFLLMVEIALTRSHEQIAHAGCHHLGERTVAFQCYFFVGAVVTDTIHLRCGQLITVHLIHPALHGLYDFGIVKRIDMVPSFSVAAVAAEVAAVVGVLECHAKVVARRVERIAGMRDVVAAVLAHMCDEDVVATQSRMAGAGEIEVAVVAERGEGLVALGVNGCPKVLNPAEAGRGNADAPNVKPALATGHVRGEIEPFAVGRNGGMGKARERIG